MSAKIFDQIVAGGGDDFMTVRHIVLKGAQSEIGATLAQIAHDELGVRKTAWTDPVMTRAQKIFLARNWPQHFERTKAVAQAFSASIADDSIDFSFLAYDLGIPGCSCVYYPASTTGDGHNILSRNFDYTTGGPADMKLAGGAFSHLESTSLPYCSRPFLVETHPDQGYSTLGMCAFDLLGCLTDGINSKGLSVALLNDVETAEGSSYEPMGMNGVGLNESQVPKFLLETCADADEALMALLTTKQCYVSSPAHYLVGDQSGRGFVWQYTPQRNKPQIIDNGQKPITVTNHQLLKHGPVTADGSGSSLDRLQVLNDAIAKRQEKFSRNDIRTINGQVQALTAAGEGQYASSRRPTRTLWYGCYDLDARTIELDYYLGEAGGLVRRSEPRLFRLVAD